MFLGGIFVFIWQSRDRVEIGGERGYDMEQRSQGPDQTLDAAEMWHVLSPLGYQSDHFRYRLICPLFFQSIDEAFCLINVRKQCKMHCPIPQSQNDTFKWCVLSDPQSKNPKLLSILWCMKKKIIKFSRLILNISLFCLKRNDYSVIKKVAN